MCICVFECDIHRNVCTKRYTGSCWKLRLRIEWWLTSQEGGQRALGSGRTQANALWSRKVAGCEELIQALVSDMGETLKAGRGPSLVGY